jgi:hypothetical protein
MKTQNKFKGGHNEMQPTQKMLDAYQRGQELAEKSYEDIIYGDLAPDSYFFNDVLNLFFEAGKSGRTIPPYVTGWRYGNIPACGKSYNYRDQRPEPGVSLMAIDGDEMQPTDGISIMFIAAQNRPVVKVSGWLHFKRGSDGEPCLVSATEIKEV